MTLFDQLGGETFVKIVVKNFYEIMDSDPKAALIRSLHAKSLKPSEEKLFLFMTGWLGGPPLYMNKYGHPRLRARHLPFKIDETEREQWMYCMTIALEKSNTEESIGSENYQKLWKAIYDLADFMRNQ